MTWSARIADKDGNFGTTEGRENYQACQVCKHKSFCILPNMSNPVGNILTAADTGRDGYMASGTAVLKCNGFEAREVASEG